MKQTYGMKLNYQESETRLKVILIIIVFILAVIAVTAFLVKIQVHSEQRILPEPIAFDFPTDYTVLEGVDPDERVLFEGFRTSFLPDEELMLCQFNQKSKRDVPDDNDTSVMFLWNFPEEVTVSKRLKRKSNKTSNNDTTRFRLYTTDGKKKKEIGSKSADYDNDEFEYNRVDEKEYPDDVFEDEGDINTENDEEGNKNDENDQDGDYCNKKYEYDENDDYNDKENEDYTEPHSDYPNYFFKGNKNPSFKSDTFLRNSSEEEFISTTKLKRKCMNDSDNDIEVPYYYFEGSKKEKNNSINLMSEKDGDYDIGEEDFRDYDEPHANKRNIARNMSEKVFSKKKSKKIKWKANSTSKQDLKENNATDYIIKEDEDYADGDIIIYKDNIEANSDKEKKETKFIDEEDEDNVENFEDANNRTYFMNKGDKDYVRIGGKKANIKVNAIIQKDKGYLKISLLPPTKENNETNPNSEEVTNYEEKVGEEANDVERDKGKANIKTNSINKGYNDYVENGGIKENKETNPNAEEDANYVEKDETNYVEKEDANYVEKDETNYVEQEEANYVEKEREDIDYLEGDEKIVKNKTNSVNKGDKDYEEKRGKYWWFSAKANKTNFKNKGDKDYVEKGGNKENNKINLLNKRDMDYAEKGGRKANNKTNSKHKGDKDYVEKLGKYWWFSAKANNKTNLINKEDMDFVEKGGRKANDKTNFMDKGDKNYVEKRDKYWWFSAKAHNKSKLVDKGDKDYVEKSGNKVNNKTNSVNKGEYEEYEEDKDNVERGGCEQKNEINFIDRKDKENNNKANSVDVDNVAGKNGKAKNKTNSINKGDKYYVEKCGRKENNETNPNGKEDAYYVEKEDADYVKGDDGKAKNKTNSINKRNKDYIEKGNRKEKKENNPNGKKDGNHGVKENAYYIEGDDGKVNNKSNLIYEGDVKVSRKENNETNTESKDDDEVYEESKDGLHLKKGVNNEIKRGSDDGTFKCEVYDDYYKRDGIEKKGENDKPKVKHQNNKKKGIERKSSKKTCSKKKRKGSRKLKQKTNATSKRNSLNHEEDEVNSKEEKESNSTEIDHECVYDYYNEPEGGLVIDKCNDIERGSENGTTYNVDIDNYSEGDEVQKDGDKSDDLYQDNENEGIESMVRPQTHVDRGPLDDVVEQVRGQPELEEGEMPSSVHLYKPVKLHSGIHALFKEQGDKNTIRAIQASIMRRNMDAEADPCQDFYQYACGNWAALNPIPADKAGYDTFEMLRENLDSILKDLLEFSKDEKIKSKYPGAHLDIKDSLLKGITYQNPNNKEQHQTTIKVQLREVLKGTNKRKSHYHLKKPEQEKSEIVHRIRHILNRKPRATLKHLKAHQTKIFHSIRQPNQRHKRRLKQKRLVKQSLTYYPRRKFKLKTSKNPDTVFLRRKIQGVNGNRKDRPKREVKCKKPGTPSNNGDEAAGDAAMKARFLFKSCMNYGILQKRGHQPLLDLLNLLGGWPILDPTWHKTDFDWLELMAKLRVYNNDILISEWVGPDIKNSDEFVIQFDQTSLGLPTREYFLQDSNKVYLNAYKNYLIKIALLLGGDKQYVEESAEKLIDFEIKLAKITSAPEDRRNVSELYRRMTLQKLENMVPEVKWRRYLCVVMNRTVYPNETVVLFALNYVRHLVTLIHDTDSRILSNYLLWRFVRHRVNNLDDRFQSAKQQFYFILFGREQAPPRWKNCISQVNSNMGMALGSMFVKKYFDETSKNDTLTMTREIQQSFRELLHNITWIDNDTKKLAAHKVDAMMLRIGYPNFILSKDQLNERYKEVRIHPDKYFENILNILQHLTQMEQSRIGQPVNKTLWNTAPAVVNAYYSRNKNQIMFPAGILQPPFYHRHFPRSLNYGGIGVVIGHEITHGFDDKGRLFDCNGNLHRWWSDTAIESFHRRAQCLIDQYGQYVVSEVSMKLDGINTQGENIADNGGVKQAFRAYRHWVQQHGTEGETLPGLNHTHTQLFFLNFAQVWCGAMRPEAMRNKLKTAVHSPGRFRVIGTLSNSVDFAREFKCPPGSPMNPTNKCTVW